MLVLYSNTNDIPNLYGNISINYDCLSTAGIIDFNFVIDIAMVNIFVNIINKLVVGIIPTIFVGCGTRAPSVAVLPVHCC